ncbi:MAG: CDGSH iron-sulfur domain-containing protein [Devosiaceae bacterium]|nr:CDGSH iron-sulfur domain-containing protein [Devosiaceae bacterium MH13]
MSDTASISPKDDGPLLVSNGPGITDAQGVTADAKPVVALCRCGASANKPFCDGSHAAASFSSAPGSAKLRNTPIDYSGTVDGVPVTISYTPVLCTHAAQCQAKAASVFDPKAKPWVQPDGGKLTEIMDVMAACPSGALRVSVGDQEPQHLTTGEVSIRIEKDGPYHVTNVGLEAEFNGEGASRAKYSLCRCGLSNNKPFCDGSHYDAKWSDGS